MPWWVWLLVIAGVFAVVAFLLRDRLRYLIKVAKALATDERIPTPLRWGLRVALAMKVVPVPDFGIDEIILIVIGLLLVTVYRPTLRSILEESRASPAQLADPLAGE